MGAEAAAAIEAAAIEAAVSRTLRARGPVVLAVSGGRDSMALLHAAGRCDPASVAVVATFDHRTGPHACRALALAAQSAARVGVRFAAGRAGPHVPPTEAGWREARWRFLREAAAAAGATVVVTAHTRDDQVETVAMRILRRAGARGLAGLDVDGDIARPWLSFARSAVARYGDRHGVEYVEDPTNQSRAHLRNRVRLDLLPALRRVQPAIDDCLLAIGADAAAWRRRVERVVRDAHPVRREGDGCSIAVSALAVYDAPSLAVVWPVLAAEIGITLDRRGVTRLAQFTRAARTGSRMQLSGGVEVLRSRFSFVLQCGPAAGSAVRSRTP